MNLDIKLCKCKKCGHEYKGPKSSFPMARFSVYPDYKKPDLYCHVNYCGMCYIKFLDKHLGRLKLEEVEEFVDETI